jgi:hypothetical protein
MVLENAWETPNEGKKRRDLLGANTEIFPNRK